MSVLYRRIDVLREGCFVLFSAGAGFAKALVRCVHWTDDGDIHYLPGWGQFRGDAWQIISTAAAETRNVLNDRIRACIHLKGMAFMAGLTAAFPAGVLPEALCLFWAVLIFAREVPNCCGYFWGFRIWQDAFLALLHGLQEKLSSPWALGSRCLNLVSVCLSCPKSNVIDS